MTALERDYASALRRLLALCPDEDPADVLAAVDCACAARAGLRRAGLGRADERRIRESVLRPEPELFFLWSGDALAVSR